MGLGCGANHNQDERERYAEAHGYGQPEDCIATCLPTPPPERVDCEREIEGYEFYPIIDITSGNTSTYVYDDKTATSTFGEISIGYQPSSYEVPRCKGDDEENPNYVGYVRGGPYLYYGGGTGRSMNELTESVELPYSPEFGRWARDASQWEGVSFWARRGVESQSVRVAVGDKFTDEDLAYVDYYSRALDLPESEDHPRAEQQYCRRARECDCPLGKPCSYYDAGNADSGYYCWDPARDLPPLSPKPTDPDDIPPGTRFRQPSQGMAQVDHDRCGETACNRFYSAYEGKAEFIPPSDHCPPNTSCEDGQPLELQTGGYDPEFYGRSCTLHTFSSGHSREYCFDPGKDPPPPENDEWCTDVRYAPVYLTTEWRFYTVPFSEMLQYGYAKETFDLDLESVATVKFTWDRGWIEFWYDDVSFYRRVDR